MAAISDMSDREIGFVCGGGAAYDAGHAAGAAVRQFYDYLCNEFIEMSYTW